MDRPAADHLSPQELAATRHNSIEGGSAHATPAPREFDGCCRRREVLLLIGLCCAIFVTRLPWISAGFGSDADAYRVVDAAKHIAQTGEYMVSRLPGYPVHEYLTACTSAWTNPLLSNSLTALASCVACCFMALILRQFQVRPYLLLTAGFAMTPVVYVNSVNTMDYMFAAAGVLASTYCVLIHRPLVAGICLGLAIGCRMTSGAMLLPLAFWMLMEERTAVSARRILVLSVSALAVGGICFLPVIHRYGLDLFRFYGNLGSPSFDVLYWVWVLGVWGEPAALGLVGLGCGVPFVIPHIKHALQQVHVRQGLALSMSVTGLYFVAFLSLPREAAYLLPAVPFMLLAIGLLMPPNFVRCFAVILLLSSFISIGNQMGVTLYGPIRMDHGTRETRIRRTSKILARVAELPEPAVVVVGWNLPQILVTASDELNDQHEFVYFVDDMVTYQRYVQQSRVVYYLPGMEVYNLQENGVDLKGLGARQLDGIDEK